MFWLRCFFLILQKHRKYRCFGSILGLREEENIVNSGVLSLVGAENIVNYDVLNAFRNRSFRTWKGKNIAKIQKRILMLICVFRHSPKTPFSLLQKHRKYRCFGSGNSVVLSLVGTKNIANYDVLSTFLHASVRTRQAKNIVKYSVFVVSLSLSSIFAFSLAAKTS